MQNGRYVKNKPVNTYKCEICTYLCKNTWQYVHTVL